MTPKLVTPPVAKAPITEARGADMDHGCKCRGGGVITTKMPKSLHMTVTVGSRLDLLATTEAADLEEEKQGSKENVKVVTRDFPETSKSKSVETSSSKSKQVRSKKAGQAASQPKAATSPAYKPKTSKPDTPKETIFSSAAYKVMKADTSLDRTMKSIQQSLSQEESPQASGWARTHSRAQEARPAILNGERKLWPKTSG